MKNVCRQICFIALAAVMALTFAAPLHAGGILGFLAGIFGGGNTTEPPKNVVVFTHHEERYALCPHV